MILLQHLLIGKYYPFSLPVCPRYSESLIQFCKDRICIWELKIVNLRNNLLIQFCLQFMSQVSPFSTIHNLLALEKYLPKTIALCSDYRQAVSDLFKEKEAEDVSIKHLTRNIIINPKAIFPLIQSPFLIGLKCQNLQQYYKLKTEILTYVKYLIQDFPLNAKFIYEEAYLMAEGNRKTGIVTYLVKDLSEALLWQSSSQNGEYQQIFEKYQAAATGIFYQICSLCTLRTSQLKLITNNLTDFYYSKSLSTRIIVQGLRLLDAGLQERNITPYLYFIDNNKSDSIKVLFSNNKWPFRKGMTMFLWMTILKQTDCRVLWIKTESKNELILRVRGAKLYVESLKGKSQNLTTEICDFPINSIVMMGLQLVASNQSVIKSASYILNININGSLYENVTSNVPKFEANEFITQFSLLSSYIGNFYSLIVTTCPQLCQFKEISKMSQYGICKQSLVWQLIESKVLKVDSIICIFNSERTFEGLLLNYVSERNHACYEGRISQTKYHKYDQKIIQIYLPFLYMMSLIKRRDEQWSNLFDLILQHILQIISGQFFQIDSILFVLYFLEINEYNISQSTLNCLFEQSKEHDNFFLNLVIRYLDVHTLIERGLLLEQEHEPYDDPVQKNILLFHLETRWHEKWNSLQGFEGWWSPHFFYFQNDIAFNENDFMYSKKRQNRVEWSVMNLVTKDYCKCFVEPIFIIPEYAILNRFQQDYVKRQCFLQTFKLNLHRTRQHEVLYFKKSSSSSFNKMKNKIIGHFPEVDSPSKKKNQSFDLKQFATECLFMDVLSVVEGIIKITKDGHIIFVSKHKDKAFDHMCIKAFKNQVFYYISLSFTDVRKIYKKRFNANQNGVYIKTKDGREIMLYFYLKNTDTFLGMLQNHIKIQKDSCLSYLHSHQPFQWIDKHISNYEYLQWLNEIAGRSYNDITQYPVLPWVYVAETQTQNNYQARQYRDLTKNMGGQGDEERIKHFLQKFYADNEEELFREYHFGTHYCSSAIIFNFLIRIRPFSIGALSLQSGKFDCADRIFYSYYGSWNNAISSPTDLRELIPELYTLPEIYININNYHYGLTQQKIVVDNVILPSWADNNPYKFVAKLRKQLQSKFVSDHINNWIDLIYGFKQRGKDAIEHMNIFYPLTYEHCIDLSKVKDEDEKMSFQTQIAHFGQTPSQIIGNNPHPSRKKIKSNWQNKLIADGAEVTIQKCFLSKVLVKQQKFMLKSIFQGKNSILSIKFITDKYFFVLRKNDYYLFKIVNWKQNFLQKDQEESYQLQSCSVSLNYKELSSFVPVAAINEQIVIVGGFFNGNTHLIFLNQPKYNKSFKFPTSTITALVYQKRFHTLLVGDEDGYMRAYRVTVTSKQIQFEYLKLIKAHDSKINNIIINEKSNLICTCSKDGSLSLYNLYSLEIIRTIRHPNYLPIHYAQITTSPLYALVFYSKQDSTVYVYSINGQFLDSFCEKTGLIYNMTVLKATDSTESLVYLNGMRELLIWQLPFLNLKRKVKVKKDDFKVSCFQTCSNSKIAIVGSDGGAMQIVTNLSCYSQ